MSTGKKEVIDYLMDESFTRYVVYQKPEEVASWEKWMNSHPDENESFQQAKEIIAFIVNHKKQINRQDLSKEVYERLRDQILSEKVNKKPSTKRMLKKFWYAAAFFVVLLGAALLMKHFKSGNEPLLESSYLQVIVPEGQRSQIILPDGSKVWLNSGSVLKYPSYFMSSCREVFVSGEAFFKVVHDRNTPFLVHMKEGLSVKVLGTEFNIKCYDEDKTIETTLVSGKIQLIQKKDNRIIKQINILPEEKATYHIPNKVFEVSRLTSVKPDANSPAGSDNTTVQKETAPEVEIITAWKDDALVFNNETFEDISVKMERWFGMKINIADKSLKEERFTGKFVNNETIYQILDIFNRSEPIRYSRKNKEITIYRKNK